MFVASRSHDSSERSDTVIELMKECGLSTQSLTLYFHSCDRTQMVSQPESTSTLKSRVSALAILKADDRLDLEKRCKFGYIL